ncbi:MAG: helical backbone metal receptor [Acidobacteriota bacterium]|nr:helical backbone metal receptor [Acidobacteriota bacterium]
MVASTPVRIVSLCPSLTELIFDLGRGRDLVAITDYCVRPAIGTAGIEKVGGTKTPAVERIIALAPDLVLLNDEENCIEDARALAQAGLSCLSTLPRNPTETAAMVRSVGRAVERTESAEKIAREIESRAARVADRADSHKPVRFAYVIWRKPWMTVNGDTYAHSLLALAGGINVFEQHRDRYPELSSRDLAVARPAVVFLGSEPFPFDQEHARELAQVTDLAPSCFVLADGELLSWHGSRTAQGIDYAARLIEEARTTSRGR